MPLSTEEKRTPKCNCWPNMNLKFEAVDDLGEEVDIVSLYTRSFESRVQRGTPIEPVFTSSVRALACHEFRASSCCRAQKKISK